MDKPVDLGVEGSKFWEELHEWVEDIRPDEYRLVELAARTLDDITELETVFNSEGRKWTVSGSTKQPVINPLRSERRFLIETFARLIRQLGVPDSEERALQRADDISKKMSGLARLKSSAGAKR